MLCAGSACFQWAPGMLRSVMQEQGHAILEQCSAHSSMALVMEAFTCAGQGVKSTVSTSADRLARTGLVFQFPERHFLASTLQQASPPMLPRLSDGSVLTASTWMVTSCVLWSGAGSDVSVKASGYKLGIFVFDMSLHEFRSWGLPGRRMRPACSC